MPKRRKKRISGVALLWVLFIGNVAAGLWYSPSTAARKVRIEGAPQSQQANIGDILAKLRDQPCLLVDAPAIESRLQGLPGVRTATLHRNVLGSATLKIELHRAVASIKDRAGLYLSDTGVLFKSQEPQADLPELDPPKGFDAPLLSMAGSWEAGSAAKVCRLAAAIPIPVEDSPKLISIKANGSVSLRVGGGALVDLGDTQDLERKFSNLRELLQTHSQLFVENSSINLVDPNRPMITPKR